jgi:hypothetical protein
MALSSESCKGKPMAEKENLQADITRIAKLKELATSGMIDGPSSYFNHLIDIYGEVGRLGASRTFTDRERQRVDLFIESFVK